MYNITPTSHFRECCPAYRGRAIVAKVKNSDTSDALKAETNRLIATIQAAYTTESIKMRPGIQATRLAYKTAGKDPSRYRPACEQLARRILQGKGLYSINALVDLGNLVSLFSGYSTAALNADALEGEAISLDFGREGEPYEAIGRGPLNIAHLPTYRDALGAFATPTSDSMRTRILPDTTHLLLLINAFDGDADMLNQTTDYAIELLKQFAEGTDFVIIDY